MTGLKTRLADVCERLNAHGARYVLVGASAMQLWGTSRATRDIDLLIDPTLENARNVLDALEQVGFGTASELAPEHVVDSSATILGDMPNVGILNRAWNVQWKDAREHVRVFTLEGVPIPTASIDDLIASKRSGQVQDAADIEVLEEIRRLRGEQGVPELAG